MARAASGSDSRQPACIRNSHPPVDDHPFDNRAKGWAGDHLGSPAL